jgi:hypothetical protein
MPASIDYVDFQAADIKERFAFTEMESIQYKCSLVRWLDGTPNSKGIVKTILR